MNASLFWHPYVNRKSRMCQIINGVAKWISARENPMPLRKSDANFQGIHSHVILAVTLHLAQCNRLARRCHVSRSDCNPRETAPAPYIVPWSRYTKTWSDWNSTRISRSPFRGRISLRQFRKEPNLPKQRYSTYWLHGNAGIKFAY